MLVLVLAGMGFLLLWVGWKAFLFNAGSLVHLSAPGEAEALPDGHPRGSYWSAAAAIEAGDFAGAVALLEPLAAGGDPQANQYLGHAYLSLGDYFGAISAWTAVRNVDGLLQIAGRARQEQQVEPALAAYAAVWELDPRAAASDWAGLLVELGRGEEAVGLLQASIDGVNRFERNIPYWYRQLANTLMELERWPEAVEAWQGVIDNAHLFYAGAADHDKTYAGLARSLLMAGRVPEAREAVELSLSYETNTGSLLLAGQIYLAAGDEEAALGAYRTVLLEDPGNAEALQAVQEIEGG